MFVQHRLIRLALGNEDADAFPRLQPAYSLSTYNSVACLHKNAILFRWASKP